MKNILKVLIILMVVGFSTNIMAQETTIKRVEIASVLKSKPISLKLDVDLTITCVQGNLYFLRIFGAFDLHLRLNPDSTKSEYVFDVINNPYISCTKLHNDIHYGNGHPEKVVLYPNNGLFVAFKEFNESIFIYNGE